jgi:uncharacterized membrane protein
MAYTGETCELPRFEGLGFLVGDTNSFALDVSGNGRVVVGRSSVQVGTRYIETPFYWTHETGMKALTKLSGRATASNSDGSVVVGTTSEGQAFRWIAGKGVTELGAPTGGTSAAVDTSEDGSVVIGFFTEPSNGGGTFRWTMAGGLQPLDPTISSLTGVSRDSSILVGTRVVAGVSAAFRWSVTGGFFDFTPAEGTNTTALAMTSDASAVSGSGLFSGAFRVFRWSTEQPATSQFLRVPSAITEAGERVTVRGLSDNPERIACYVSVPGKEPKDENAEEKVGSACFGMWGSVSSPRTAVYVSDLAATLLTLGVELDGWTLTRSNAISADGTILVGSGIDPDGNSQAWVARLPEP